MDQNRFLINQESKEIIIYTWLDPKWEIFLIEYYYSNLQIDGPEPEESNSILAGYFSEEQKQSLHVPFFVSKIKTFTWKVTKKTLLL